MNCVVIDENIENLKLYENKTNYKDFFFALSHGVNFGKLKKNSLLQKIMVRLKQKKIFLNTLFKILVINQGII